MSASSSPARLVLIEDNHADVRLLQQALDETGEPYVLKVLADGEAALLFIAEQALLEAPEPCLIILDLYLPRHDGTAILEVLRGNPALAHLRVAVLTTLASPEQEDDLKRLGVQLYRRKASSWEGVQALARELLDLCHSRSHQVAAG